MTNPPKISPDWALLLDLDGTLIDIASAPDEVEVPPSLPQTLSELRDILGGALAIVSGRQIERIDSLLHPARFPLGAEHGALVRSPSGAVEVVAGLEAPRAEWIEELKARARAWPGAIVEVKSYAVAVHFRLAPEFEAQIRGAMNALVRGSGGGWLLVDSKMAVELRHANANKGHAVAKLMGEPPFASRIPVFVGDDVTDEDGITMAVRLGGFGLRVAEAFAGQPSNVRAWLQQSVIDIKRERR